MEKILHAPLGPEALHLCIDMQEMFGPASPWAVPWMERVLPAITQFAAARPERAVFTRFVPPRRIGDAVGSWARYYAHWPQMLRETLTPRCWICAGPCARLCRPRACSTG